MLAGVACVAPQAPKAPAVPFPWTSQALPLSLYRRSAPSGSLYAPAKHALVHFLEKAADNEVEGHIKRFLLKFTVFSRLILLHENVSLRAGGTPSTWLA